MPELERLHAGHARAVPAGAGAARQHIIGAHAGFVEELAKGAGALLILIWLRGRDAAWWPVSSSARPPGQYSSRTDVRTWAEGGGLGATVCGWAP